jgi:hypothetical protein
VQGLPENGNPSTVATYGLLLVTMGTLKVWAAPACNNPIFAEIVPPHMRNMIYAFDRCFEGAIAACAAPLVGVLAEHMFGFQGGPVRVCFDMCLIYVLIVLFTECCCVGWCVGRAHVWLPRWACKIAVKCVPRLCIGNIVY